jgi:hypothetical protein
MKMDEEIMKAAMVEAGNSPDEVKKYRSAVRPKTVFWYLVFDREADGGGKPVLRPYEFPMQVKDALAALQTLQSKKRPGMLENGLNFMYDIYITKDNDGKTGNAMYDTKYTVQPVNETLPIMKKINVPADWVNFAGDGDCPWNWQDYFTDDELEAIDAYTSDLEAISAPQTETEIIERLTKNPIFLHAKFNMGDKKGELMFPFLQAPEYVAQLQAAMVSAALLTTGDGQVSEAPAPAPRPSPKPIPSARQIPAKTAVPVKPPMEDAQVVDETAEGVVEEQAPVTPPVPAKKLSISLPKPAATAPAPAAKPATAPAPAATPNTPVKRVWAPPKKV